ncbi:MULTISPECIES: FGGY-family carbohydrate kinase [unclassified Rhizobium]|uniref:FGGY-family carbohydrate kinase n=1 Tax=unclassified Rhizobium TaxID=2613769 RepID=UPI002478EDED|nr:MULTISPECIES: carbohydrate kinase [unclassified Rhizobium]MDH7803315.1 sugar (pentulose or hexulose) kinase [Rhizobium sp. AN70]
MSQPPIAVFDLGKTNSKLFVLSAEGRLIDEARTRPVWLRDGDFQVLDDDTLFAWMKGELARVVSAHGVDRVTFSGHGCTFALAAGDALVHPILDYEQEPPAEIAARIDALVPDFRETFSPPLPLGFSYGRHILWLNERDPALLERADAILAYPQFWSWKFSGRKVSEVSYLGCHSHLWAPIDNDYSSLVDRMGWRGKMPAFARAGSVIGTHSVTIGDGQSVDIAVHNGVHDSNAALYFYRSLGFSDFTLISTGTWVIIFNPASPLESLDAGRDMLANVTVDRQPVATIRFMGGREYDLASGGWTMPVSAQAVAAVIAQGSFALPSFAAGGPMQGHAGHFIGPAVADEERAATALLYVTLMTDLSLDLIGSQNTVVIDGGLVKTGLYAAILAALRPDQTIHTSANPEGSAFGAAALVFDETGGNPFVNDCSVAQPATIPGLDAYRRAWRRQVDAMAAENSEYRSAV